VGKKPGKETGQAISRSVFIGQKTLNRRMEEADEKKFYSKNKNKTNRSRIS
jgi:hypothetical protein